MAFFLSLFLLSLCALGGSIIYALWPQAAPPPPDAAETLPPSDFLPDITAATHNKLWDALK